jgi:adenylosuccinate lyase
MRRYGIEKPYEKLKALTRGNTIDQATIEAFVHGLDMPDQAKADLIAMLPSTYIGNAAQQAKNI